MVHRLSGRTPEVLLKGYASEPSLPKTNKPVTLVVDEALYVENTKHNSHVKKFVFNY